MKKTALLPTILSAILFFNCTKQVSNIEVSFPEKFEGENAELAIYDDTTHIQSVDIADRRASFTIAADTFEMPVMAQIIINNRAYGYAIIEPGNIIISDSTRIGTGTKLNDSFNRFCQSADSIESTDDISLYINFLKREYEVNKENPIGLYAAVELCRWLEMDDINSIIGSAPESVKKSHRVARYRQAAALRANTTPGKHFIDFEAEQPDGKTLRLSDFAGKGDYVIVDFWASWCPYCIKELPSLKQIQQKFAGKNLKIVGVAVRDTEEDTKCAIEKHGITWNVMYNAQRIPYDIYGFTGIPHLMLISPDGTIISRGESPEQISKRLEKLLK